MCMCFVCDAKPHPYDKYHDKPHQFQVGICAACCAEPLCCLGQCVCPCCVQYSVRKEALGGNLDDYKCCQGYFHGCCCCRPGHMCEKECPCLCLCIESCCCNSCAVSATRMLVMDKYDLASGPCDKILITCSNCILCFSCICDLLACIHPSLREGSRILDCLAHLVYVTVSGCMTAQVHHELKYQKKHPRPNAAVAQTGLQKPV